MRIILSDNPKYFPHIEQKSVIVAISQNVAQLGEADGEELPGKNIGIQDLLFAKVINADSYIL